MPMLFFANDSTYSGSTVNIVADYQFTNPVVNTSNHIKSFFILKALLKTCGWTVKSSGDGVFTYSTGSDIITMGTGTNGGTNGVNTVGDLFNGSAWFYLQSPGTSSQHFCFQRPSGIYGNTTQGWRIKYSTTGFFLSGMTGSTGLTGSITVTPTAISASDEVVLFGGGTDAAPVFASFNPLSFTAVKSHMAANSSEPYGFWLVSYAPFSDPSTNGLYFVNDPMFSGSFPGLDAGTPDSSPYVAGIWDTLNRFLDQTQQLSMVGSFVRNLATARDDYLPQPTLVHWGGLSYNFGSNVIVPLGCGINPQTQKVDLLPIFYLRRRDTGGSQVTLGQTGFKGISSLMRFPLYNLANGEVFDYNSPRDKVCFGFLVFDWNGTDFVST